MVDLNINGYEMTTFTSNPVIRGAIYAHVPTYLIPTRYLCAWLGIIGLIALPALLSAQTTGLEVTGNAGTIQNEQASISWAIGAVSPGSQNREGQQFRIGYIFPSAHLGKETIQAAEKTSVVRVFPNPFTERIDLLPISHARNNLTIHVQDALGRTVHTQPWPDPSVQCSLTLDQLPAGAYSLSLRTANGTIEEKTLTILKKDL